jgi:omega-6 fatty acid desaturase (delta-12 desaturase)
MTIRDHLQAYTGKSTALAAASYFGTFAAFFSLLYLAIAMAGTWYLAAPLVVLTAFAGVRLYVLQHDCGHHSLFVTRRANEIAGYAMSTFTLTPFRAMKVNHDLHHAYLGNLEHRETTEIHTMTLREWNAASGWQRLYYRLYRNPLIMLPLGGAFTFILRYRWPKNTRDIGVWGVLAHDALLAGFVAVLYLLFGWAGPVILLCTALVSGVIGVFLVYLQHNFEDTYWDRKPHLDIRQAALQGSSALDLGHWFDIGTGNIAYHDIHHYMPSIPSYRLRKCHHALPAEFAPHRIGWREALASFRLRLWDEDARRLVPFPPARQTAVVPAE